MVIDPCAKYVIPMSKHTEVTGYRPVVKSKVLTYNFLANKPIAL